MADLEFIECASCAKKPGTPPLCASCLHNRRVISALSEKLKVTAVSFKRFAPDLAEELNRRFRFSGAALEDFIENMRFE